MKRTFRRNVSLTFWMQWNQYTGQMVRLHHSMFMHGLSIKVISWCRMSYGFSFFNPELLFKAVINRKGKITHWLPSISEVCAGNRISKYLIDMTFKFFWNYPITHCCKSKHGVFEEPWDYCKCPIKFPVEYSWLSGYFWYISQDILSIIHRHSSQLLLTVIY